MNNELLLIFVFIFEIGDSATGIHKQSLYEHNGVAVCSQRRALIIASTVFAILFSIAIIIAYAGPQSCKYNYLQI